jgi:hypothetical protein
MVESNVGLAAWGDIPATATFAAVVGRVDDAAQEPTAARPLVVDGSAAPRSTLTEPLEKPPLRRARSPVACDVRPHACDTSSGGGGAPTLSDATPRAVFKNVASYAADYFYQWCVQHRRMNKDEASFTGLSLIAAGREDARLPTCQHALRVLDAELVRTRKLLERAISLFGPEELQELHLTHGKSTIKVIVELLKEERKSSSSAQPLSRALESLRSVRCLDGSDIPSALIEPHVATLTELSCNRLTRNGELIVSRCARLETLTMNAMFCRLELSQLHTLCGDHCFTFRFRGVAAIVKALPRLHTLHLTNISQSSEFPWADFCDLLLPRLRSFRVKDGYSPNEDELTPKTAALKPLPRLKDLQWFGCVGFYGQPPQLPHAFMGAQPETLIAFPRTLQAWLWAVPRRESGIAESPLARLKYLQMRTWRSGCVLRRGCGSSRST